MLGISTRVPLPTAIQGVSRGVHAPADNIRTFGQPWLPRSSNSKHKDAIVFSVIREIEIWRVAVLMVSRYADEAEANSFQRAEEREGRVRRSGEASSGRRSRWRGYLASDHCRDRAAYRHNGAI